MTDSNRERETSVHLRSLVDTVLEEGNLDSAIILLDRLRNPVYKPYGPHIRHVLYLALFPPPTADAPTPSAPVLDIIPSSPSKFAAKNRQPFCLSPTLIEAAQNLLRALVQTHSPASIARALPNYGLTGVDNFPDVVPIADNKEDDGESELSRLSRRIKDARSCWDIVKENYIRPDPVNDIPYNSGRKSGRLTTIQSTSTIEDSDHILKPVADHAFPVLESLVSLFEKEESTISTRFGFPFSPHFLAQIPSSRSASGARWDVAAPLDIIFYCLQQSSHADLGAKMLVLLINLTNTVHLDFAMLLNAVATRLLSLSPECLQTMFSLLPPSATSLKFQVSLCQLSLAHSSGGSHRSRPRPQARNAHRPVPSRLANDPSLKGSSFAVDSSMPSTLARKFPPVHFTEVLETFSSPLSPDTDPPTLMRKLHLKFFLITAVGELQDRVALVERDPDWVDIVQSGRLKQAIDFAFSLEDIPNLTEMGRELAEDLKNMLSLVSAGWCMQPSVGAD
ncbi:hypothetical protein BDY19DRAFT_989625 [Irpex rosettiformis]|uniref:Uncharacterized protein n=1 Tax=Irpex rosettiformis TaxID=378272 RepID=A0ACB8UFJ6_9APHY|nr:hypothetical protein BDY19DRAFT_989625 [Irpex rosettiformis]